MPQISTCRLIVLDAKSEESVFTDIQDTICQVKHDLENEVSEAIMEENVTLAERLVLPISRLRKLSELIDIYMQSGGPIVVKQLRQGE